MLISHRRHSRMKLPRMVFIAFSLLCAQAQLTEAQSTDGFSKPYVLQFKLNSAPHMASKEVLRQGWEKAGASSGAGVSGGDAMANDAMNNVIQLNTTIVINGDGNTVNQDGGTVTADQNSEGTSQSSTNSVVTCGGVLNSPDC